MSFFKFLALPAELRNMIYRYTLTTDPTDLEREHKYDCSNCTWEPGQQPPPIYVDGKRVPGCRCLARTGLDLLLVNRGIYWEGASIFWSENHFNFMDLESFNHLVGTRLRPRWRKTIRSVSIHYCNSSNLSDAIRHKFWRVLLQCQGLRTLGVIHQLGCWLPCRCATRNRPDAGMAYWEDLTRLLPELRTLTFMAWTAPTWRGQTLLTRSIDVKELPPEQFRVFEPQIAEINDLVDHALWSWALYQWLPPLPSWMEIFGSTEGARHTVCRVQLPSFTLLYTMRHCFEPVSPETIARNKALRDARDKSLLSTEANGWEGRLRTRHKRKTTPP